MDYWVFATDFRETNNSDSSKYICYRTAIDHLSRVVRWINPTIWREKSVDGRFIQRFSSNAR